MGQKLKHPHIQKTYPILLNSKNMVAMLYQIHSAFVGLYRFFCRPSFFCRPERPPKRLPVVSDVSVVCLWPSCMASAGAGSGEGLRTVTGLRE